MSLGFVPALTITESMFDCTIPAVPPAFYFGGAIIDPANEVPETDETNNVGVNAFVEQIL